jgi:hypothetical protein
MVVVSPERAEDILLKGACPARGVRGCCARSGPVAPAPSAALEPTP